MAKKLKPIRTNLVDNKVFYALLVEYKATKETDPKKNREVYNEIGVIFDTMARKLLFHRWFINYSANWRDEMFSEGVYNCVRYVDKFDTDNYFNPFAYFTRVLWNSYRQILIKEKRLNVNHGIISEKTWDEYSEKYGFTLDAIDMSITEGGGESA